MAPKTERYAVTEQGASISIRLTRLGVGPLSTRSGTFHHFTFQLDDRWEKYSVLAMGELSPAFELSFSQADLLLRIDSGCETGQLFGDRTCECRDQLEVCLEKIAAKKEGLVIHIPRQDGRGLGLPFKLATLRLQTDLGVTTTEAFSMLDPDRRRDIRSYSGVIAILRFLNIPPSTPVHLASNNPHKASVFAENGFSIADLEPLRIPPTDLTRRHLEAKQRDMGQLLDLPPEDSLK